MRYETLFLILGLALAGCDGGTTKDDTGTTDGEDTDDDTTDTDDPADPPTDAERAADLWTAISGYESWAQVGPWTGIQESSDGTHGAYVQIWANTTAAGDYDAVAAGTQASFSDGAIFVKRAYTADDVATLQPQTIVMQKIDGYASATGDWFWAIYDADGMASPAGDVDMCTGCHAAGDDYSRVATDVPGGN